MCVFQFTQLMSVQSSMITLRASTLAVCTLLLSLPLMISAEDTVDKIHIDAATKLYTSTVDGRVHVFHGLAIEDSSPPWTLAKYNADQIILMKSVSDVHLSE